MLKAVFILVALTVISADQLSKIWIKSSLLPGQAIFDIGFFRLFHVYNSGAAFGIFPNSTGVLTYISALGVVLILLCAFLATRYFQVIDNVKGMVALGLVLGGTIGNLVERIGQGYVTDFLDFKVWPTFNIADSAVTVGALILAYILLRHAIAENRPDE
jgi:signal peptidase II